MSPKIEDRIKDFENNYEYKDVLELHEFIMHAFDMVHTIFGDEVCSRAMSEAYRAVFGDHGVRLDPTDWHWTAFYLRKKWTDLPLQNIMMLEVAQRIKAVHGYAYYGLPIDLRHGDFENYFYAIDLTRRHTREELETYLGSQPEMKEIGKTFDLADARWELLDRPSEDGETSDNSFVAIHVHDIATLAGVSEKTVRNLLSPSGGNRLRQDSKGRIAVSDLREWLASRPSFRGSIWQSVDENYPLELEGWAERSLEDEVVFVPVSKDGSVFHPDLKVNGAYTIGPKHQEYQVEDFQEAVRELQTMGRPCWRRPAEGGRWGLVAATHWERKTLGELGLSKGEDA